MSLTNKTYLADITERYWFNALWFQTVWFCAVLGRETFAIVIALLLIVHLLLVQDRYKELRQLLSLAAVGITVDACFSISGVYRFADDVLVPLWLCGLWFAFAAVLGRSLAFLSMRPVLASVAGLFAFPLNYWAGARLGAVEFGYSLPTSLAIIGLVWAIMLPLMYKLTAWITLRHLAQ